MILSLYVHAPSNVSLLQPGEPGTQVLELKPDCYKIFSQLEKMNGMKSFLMLSYETKMQGGAELSVITKG